MNKGLLSDARDGLSRRDLLLVAGTAAATIASYSNGARSASQPDAFSIKEVKQGEDIFAYISRMKGSFEPTIYQQVIGAANEFKEGDQAIGVGADNDATR